MQQNNTMDLSQYSMMWRLARFAPFSDLMMMCIHSTLVLTTTSLTRASQDTPCDEELDGLVQYGYNQSNQWYSDIPPFSL